MSCEGGRDPKRYTWRHFCFSAHRGLLDQKRLIFSTDRSPRTTTDRRIGNATAALPREIPPTTYAAYHSTCGPTVTSSKSK